jgi:hypothetical protein
MQPRRTSSFGERLCTSAPSKAMVPLVTSPRSARSKLEMAFSVVVLPAPLAPSSATMPPRGTSSETPFSTSSRPKRLWTSSARITTSLIWFPALAPNPG